MGLNGFSSVDRLAGCDKAPNVRIVHGGAKYALYLHFLHLPQNILQVSSVVRSIITTREGKHLSCN
jgi:hypothetical protein